MLFFFFFSVKSWAVTFIPLDFEHQLRDSSGVIRAIFQGSTYKKNSSREVITESSFKILAMAGLKNREVINKNSFKIIYPGGKWQGIVHQVSGSPSFLPSEEVILLIKKTSSGFSPLNLALGKYVIRKEFGKKYVSSQVFPKHKKLGSMSFEKVNKMIEEEFGSKLEKVNLDKFVYNKKGQKVIKRKNKRSPASLNFSKQDSRKGDDIIWLVLIFSFLGFFSLYLMRLRRKK